MKACYIKVIFSLFLLLSFVLPGSVAGMPIDIELLTDNSVRVIEIPLTGALADVDPLAPPPSEVSTEVRCNKAVYVDDQNPTSNWNSGAQRAHLRVGIGPEFGGQLWTLLSFHPVKQSQGGPLPNDAEITRAQIKLYKESGEAGTIRFHRLMDDFNESSVNWNNKPGMYATSEATLNAPAANGWVYGDIPASVVSDAVNFSRPVRAALKPSWTNIGKSVSFHSNEHPSLSPKLVIYYSGAPAAAPPDTAPAPTPPAPSTGDTTPCTLTYTITPTNPRPGQSVTITATATDNQAMYYLTIMRGSIELARRDATSGQRELQVSYTEDARLPSMTYQIFADDVSPAAAPVSRMVTVPVTGSGTAPTVTVTVEWLDVERVIPESFRLIKNDGQRARITAEASDPDGIRDLWIFINGVDHPFTYTGQTSVSETIEWVNNQPTRTRFSYYAQARDREGQTTTGEGGDHHINQPQDIRLIWHESPPDANFGVPTISWTRMCQIFGDGECWYVKGWNWRDSSAERYWEDGVRGAADGGQCFGFATLAAEFYHGRIAASELDDITGGAWQLNYSRDSFPGSGFTGAWIQARQAGQWGEEVAIPRYNRGNMGGTQTLSWVESALESNNPGVLGIREADEGHAVTPWMIRYMPDNTVRIYIYDSNKIRGIHNANADINNFGHYPYIVIDGRAWSYQWNATTVWNDQIYYFTYEEACGDMGQVVTNPRLGPGAPLLTDHDIPNSTDWYLAWVTPGADAYFEDEEGNVTGMYKGQLREEIPGSMAIIPMMVGSFTEHEMYIVPRDKKLSIHVEGTDDGEYNLSLMGESTLYSITKKKIRKGVEDLFGFEPLKDSLGYRLRIRPGVADDNFKVMVSAVFAGLVEALDEESIDREYIMEDVSATEESDFSIHVEEGGDAFVVESYGDDIQFDAVTRSTESADYVDPNIDPGYIPSSVQEDVTVEQGRRAEITPETWASTDEKGKLHTLNKRAKGEGAGGFPFVPVIIGLVVAAAIGTAAAILIKKGTFKKTA